jgi:formylglycine-generating enzyme required for sulfatase activity
LNSFNFFNSLTGVPLIMRLVVLVVSLVVALLIVHSDASARALEKKEEGDPILRLKQEHQAAYEKEKKEIADLKEKIKGVEDEIRKLDSRFGEIKAQNSSDNSLLDELHGLVAKKEGLEGDLDGLKKGLSKKEADLEKEGRKRLDEMETLKANVKKDRRATLMAALKEDISKYDKIISSPSVQGMDMKKSAWKALAAKYPKEASGVKTGDIEELQFRVIYGGITNSIGMRFVVVDAGLFTMGSPPSEKFRSDDETRHKVTISKPFYLQATEVTQGQWKEIMGENPAENKLCGMDCPVEKISWDDCHEFVKRLNRREETDKYRLPTEAEWEYACRGGKAVAFATGGITEDGCGRDPSLDQIGWYCGNSLGGRTHSVAQKKCNAFGLYDMHGNVWEWCQDWYGMYPTEAVVDPRGARYGPERVIRGGSSMNRSEKCRSAYRFSYNANVRMNNIGFRVARTR